MTDTLVSPQMYPAHALKLDWYRVLAAQILDVPHVRVMMIDGLTLAHFP